MCVVSSEQVGAGISLSPTYFFMPKLDPVCTSTAAGFGSWVYFSLNGPSLNIKLPGLLLFWFLLCQAENAY